MSFPGDGVMTEDCFLVVDKPGGLTSQQVVARVKRMLKCRKVGHTGTLDPLATGVLPLACNRATRLISFLDEGRKVYSGEIELGVESDTLDRDGEVVRRHPGRLDFSPAEIAAAMAEFQGEIEQTPPLYSAIKRDGKPLYVYARAGEAVEIPTRRVTIFDFALGDWRLPRVGFRVACSRGTYVRSLAADLGRKLGCGARIWSLRREASGPFTLDGAVTLEQLAEQAADGRLEGIAPLEVLGHLPQVELTDPELRRRIAHGRSLPAAALRAAGICLPDLAGGENLLLFFAQRLLAVACWEPAADEVRMVRVMERLT
jgi:tRNA pseudouridine55 synthase